MPKERNILLCVSGPKPAIVTETLWCLTQGYNSKKRKFPIDEVHVITTLSGKKILENCLFKSGKFDDFRKEYPDCKNVQFSDRNIHILTKNKSEKPTPTDSEAIQLKDIITDEDNECAANQVYLILKDLVENSFRLHASASGGRKTLSIYMTVMMQLLARADDTLSHVIVWDKYKSDRDFCYPSPEDLRAGENLPISLSFIPFIRLREVGKKLIDELTVGENSYSDVVESVRKNLRLAEADIILILNLKNLIVQISEEPVKLSGKRLFLLALYLFYQRDNEGRYLSDDKISKELLNSTFAELSEARLKKRYTLDSSEILSCPKLEEAYNFAHAIIEKLQKVSSPDLREKEKRDEKRGFKKYMTDNRSDLKESLTAVSDKVYIDKDGEYGNFSFGFKIKTKIVF